MEVTSWDAILPAAVLPAVGSRKKLGCCIAGKPSSSTAGGLPEQQTQQVSTIQCWLNHRAQHV
jgi:hypothetical protein